MLSHEQNDDDGESTLNITSGDPLILLAAISRENLTKKVHWTSRFSGIFYTLFASFLFTLTTFIIKELRVDFLEALFVRFLLQTVLTLSFALYKRYPLLGGTAWQRTLQILCCTSGAVSLVLFFLALRYIGLSDASTLCYTRVVWTVGLSILIYRERPSIGVLLALPLTILGVVFVTQPSFIFASNAMPISQVRVLGFAAAMGSAFASTFNVLLFKQLISTSKNIKPSVLNLQFSFTVLIFLILNQCYKTFVLQTAVSFGYVLSWRYLVASGVCLITIGASILIQKAIKREHPAVFSLLGSADIIFALLLENLFTAVRSNLYALLGSALVIGSVILIGISRLMNERTQRVRDGELAKHVEK